jgi:hypothetical protein
MGPHLAIAFFFAATDALIWLKILIFHLDKVPPKDPVGPGTFQLLTRTVLAGVGGVAGAFVLLQVTGATDLLTTLAGAYMGGRLVGGAASIFTR